MLERQAERLNETTILFRLTGRITSDTADQVEAGFTELLVDQNLRFIVVELSEVRFISSAGLRILLSEEKALNQRGGFLVITDPSPAVLEVLEMAGLFELFQSAESVDDALALIAGG